MVAVALLSIIPSQASAFGKVIKGSDNIIEKSVEVDLSGIDAISVARGIEVKLIDSDSSTAVVTANDNLMEYVEIEVSGCTLNITLSGKVLTAKNADIDVVLPYNGKITRFTAASAASIEYDTELQLSTLSIDASGAAKVSLSAAVDGNCSIKALSSAEIDLEATITGKCSIDAQSSAEVDLEISTAELEVSASSAAKVELEGSATKFIANSSSASSIDATDLVVQHSELKATSASTINYNSNGKYTSYSTVAATIKDAHQ